MVGWQALLNLQCLGAHLLGPLLHELSLMKQSACPPHEMLCLWDLTKTLVLASCSRFIGAIGLEGDGGSCKSLSMLRVLHHDLLCTHEGRTIWLGRIICSLGCPPLHSTPEGLHLGTGVRTSQFDLHVVVLRRLHGRLLNSRTCLIEQCRCPVVLLFRGFRRFLDIGYLCFHQWSQLQVFLCLLLDATRDCPGKLCRTGRLRECSLYAWHNLI
mmetsp:Transcript_94597/g.276470  ORF Transcript_94597/g.276470 Transcript_94597/m.276470 type:complete len:213 (+) Transcript_94597:256-894(+)